jgi:hypothetical protein
MKNFLVTLLFLIGISTYSQGQSDFGTYLAGGVNYSKYLGKGEGSNYFKTTLPGYQFELIMGGNGFQWTIWGVQWNKSSNYVGTNSVPVSFWSPYYTEFLFYKKGKTNPLFMFFGYDYVRMRFPDMKKPDSHHNITFGAGWKVKFSDRIFLQIKVKPYLILDNSIGQHFGTNYMLNLQYKTK